MTYAPIYVPMYVYLCAPLLARLGSALALLPMQKK